MAIGDLWQSDQILIQFFRFFSKETMLREGGMAGGMGGGKELFSLTESKKSPT